MRKFYRILIIFLIVVFFFMMILIINPPVPRDIQNNWDNYFFDAKLLRLNTSINVYKNGEKYGYVRGNIIRLITDPLTLYNTNDEVIAFADDTYHLISQDSHVIVVNNQVTAEMVGKISITGNVFDIYNNHGELIAHANFSFYNLNGKIKDTNENTIAIFKSNPFIKDFTVYVSPDCDIDENTLILIFASNYSDYDADHKNSD